MKRSLPISARAFVEDFLGQGRYTFTREEAAERLQGSPAAVYMALHRLSMTGWIAMPRSGFYIIVDPQHRAAGSLPPEWFVRDLMKDLGRPYYVGLLSAAQIHGAAHHRPQEFQVVIPTRTVRPIEVGHVRIRFYGKGPFERSSVQEVKTPTGMIRVSSPETTTWDLVRYPHAAGGLDNVVTVLTELSPRLESGRLCAAVRAHGDIVVAQRLGYLLDHLGGRDLTRRIAAWVRRVGPPVRRLDPSSSAEGAKVSRKWGVLVNANVEAEA